MEVNIERECSALGGLFQQIISDMKNGTPLWEDLIAKAAKLHTCLRATVQAIAAYLDSFQKIADSATNARGATKEIGTALTRICLRHKAIEGRLKVFTSAIMDCLILPLQEKLEDWKKIVINLDKEHAKEYKRARTELKKRSTDTLRLQKKARKGKCGELQRRVESSLQDVTERRQFLEETEKKAVRAALIEERSRFCVFVGFFKPVMNEELAILSELTHIQEAAEQLEKISADPHLLPPSSEQVIQDLKGSDSFWSFQTPPSSPSSLGSRKSSMCSISSLNSSSSGSSKSHQSLNHYWQRSASQNGHFPVRLSSVSSQDSGFRSQDALFLKYTPGLQVSNMSEQSDNDNSSTPSTPHVGTDNVPAATATWPNLQETLQFERAASAIMKDRPHTISSAYERGHQRPSLTVCTFHAPEASHSQPASPVSASIPVSNSSSSASPPALSNSSTPHVSPQAIYSRPPIPQRCSSLERPSVPAKASIPNGQIMKTDPTKTVLSKVQARLSAETNQPPMYVNMSELASMAAHKAQEMAMNLPPPPPELTEHTERTESNEKDGSTSESSLESSSGYGSQTTFPNEEAHNDGDGSVDICNDSCNSNYCTLPRLPSSEHSVKQQRSFSSAGYGTGNLRNSLLRKSSMPGQKPPPPIRRTASISSTARQTFVPSVETTGSLENLPPPPSFLLDGGKDLQ
ncbi:UNVERIFIED_CONTAM: hypothetical protein PYX00_000514 [Menopon gallinae]|uniref:IMD domain-containing protein n=1 Tax=Menopon gallinae TaxID=328185 RepID=A0AAW2I9D1_9NEOP